ncbi:hypothetical protein C8F01DRAFT_1243425 [Mycena amicta]|nr:hypothetical protein C8F01DRAFT_1243425 [Mycena amicta]
MSEYWVSKKKVRTIALLLRSGNSSQYMCKYCEIWIADDAPSRQLHENGLKHKGNLERFIRGIYKAGEKKIKDDDEERREMARVEQAAQIAFAQDVGAGRAKLGSSAPTPTASTSKKPPPKSSNPWANYSTAKSLGYEDPDAGQAIADAQGQRLHGIVGEWEVVVPQAEAPSAADTGAKRPAADALDEEESREFKLRKKTAVAGLGQIYDPGALSIKLKKRNDSPDAPLADPPTDTTTERPKWSKTQWKEAEDVDETETVKLELKEEVLGDVIKSEPELESAETVVFKKRKIPSRPRR